MDALPELPESLDLRTELVPAVRALLRRGLTDSFMRQCVRIGEFAGYAGGLKADLVGGLTLNVDAVMKLGGSELPAHALLMNAVNASAPGTFAEVLEILPLERGRWLLLMAQLRKYETLFDRVYTRPSRQGELESAVDKTLAGLRACHRLTAAAASSGLPETIDPFTPRIRSKLEAALAQEPALALMLENPGKVQGRCCPPLTDLLGELERWLGHTLPMVPRVLVHGDPHLRNVMVRPYGKGLAVRFIDPNPDYGYTDPAYDFGKLLHFAEAVGWALARPQACRARWATRQGEWTLSAQLSDAPDAAETRRAFLEAEIRQRCAGLPYATAASWPARLHVARASAHLGLLARFPGAESAAARRFVLAHALAALAEWHAASR
ncbi:MAG: aminoglycoside phosphotransferase family protein [Xanthomonadaceae bacterium]|nr:aminoglycoside phosphotransferase family protein [Xanthomonadaceae bacterium]